MNIHEHFQKFYDDLEKLETCEGQHLRGRQNIWMDLQRIQDDLREIEEQLICIEKMKGK